jgi:hypothetical protein
MPNPDVVVPSLPEPHVYVYGWSGGHLSLSHSRWNGTGPDTSKPVFTADQMNTRWLEGYEAGRAAGRASAEPERAQAEPVADARRFVYDEHVRPLYSGDDESFPGLSWYDFGSSRMHPCVINARGRTILRDGDWIVRIGTQYHAFTPEVYALLAAPTPTASIAPKGETVAMGSTLQRVMGRLADMLDDDKFNEIEGIVNAGGFAAPKAEGEAEDQLFDMTLECEGRTVEVTFTRDQINKLVERLRKFKLIEVALAAPVAQAAAGTLSDEEIDELWNAAGRTGIGHMATRLQAREFYRLAALSPRPEADADRASGGGV